MRLELSGGERHGLHEAADALEAEASVNAAARVHDEAARYLRLAALLRRLATRAGRDRKPIK